MRKKKVKGLQSMTQMGVDAGDRVEIGEDETDGEVGWPLARHVRECAREVRVRVTTSGQCERHPEEHAGRSESASLAASRGGSRGCQPLLSSGGWAGARSIRVRRGEAE